MASTNPAVSEHYIPSLEANKRHHAENKTYSGKFLRPHAPFIKDIIDRLGCRSGLDYGVGKGVQYTWRNDQPTGSIPMGMTIEEFWGFEVAKYDPAYPPFAKEPEGTFDLVICTHTLGRIPVADLDWVVDRLYGLATKAVYIAEKIGKQKKLLYGSESGVIPNGWSADQWREKLSSRPHPGIEVHLATRERGETGTEIHRVQL